MKTFQEILKEKGLTGHRLYIASGVPWRMLDDIFSGRTSLAGCSEETLGRLSNALDMPLDVLAKTKVELQPTGEYLAEPTYLETGLPPSIEKAIADYAEGEKKDVLHLDCLWGELYGAINASQWDGSITLEQADFLRKKYLFGDSEEDPEPEEMPGFGLRGQE